MARRRELTVLELGRIIHGTQAGVDYRTGDFQVGAGAQLLSLVPRTQNTVNDKVYKLDERIT